ncbi:MAG: PIG-L family deacetylase [Chloroflexi bacterium]|nr:PIG-L family deacetylase [Chloroflexota bacterium]
MWTPQRVLALSAHTDDMEFSAGGFVSRLIDAQVEVYSVIFSIARASVPAGYPEDIMAQEAYAAHQIIGVDAARLTIHDYPVRYFPEHRQPILEEMVRLNREIQPDLVLVHASTDVHQDHETVHNEAVRAFKRTTMLGYLVPWNNFRLEPRCTVPLAAHFIQRKIDAVAAYKTQTMRNYSDAEFLRSWARTCGITVNAPYGEHFEVIRWVL